MATVVPDNGRNTFFRFLHSLTNVSFEILPYRLHYAMFLFHRVTYAVLKHFVLRILQINTIALERARVERKFSVAFVRTGRTHRMPATRSPDLFSLDFYLRELEKW